MTCRKNCKYLAERRCHADTVHLWIDFTIRSQKTVLFVHILNAFLSLDFNGIFSGGTWGGCRCFCMSIGDHVIETIVKMFSTYKEASFLGTLQGSICLIVLLDEGIMFQWLIY